MTTHVINIDHSHAYPLVDVRLSGFFEPDAALSAVRAIRAAIRTLGPRIGQHVHCTTPPTSSSLRLPRSMR